MSLKRGGRKALADLRQAIADEEAAGGESRAAQRHEGGKTMATGSLLSGIKVPQKPVVNPTIAALHQAMLAAGVEYDLQVLLEDWTNSEMSADDFASAVINQLGLEGAPTPAPEPEVDTHRLDLELERDEIQGRIAEGTATANDYARMAQIMAELGGMPAPNASAKIGPPPMPPLQAGMQLGKVTAAGVFYFASDVHGYGFTHYTGFRRDGEKTNLAHGNLSRRVGEKVVHDYIRYYATGQRTDLTTDKTNEVIDQRVVKAIRGGGYGSFFAVRSWAPDDSKRDEGNLKENELPGGTVTIYEFIGDEFSNETVAHEVAYDLRSRQLVVTNNTKPFEFQAPPESVEDLEIPF